MKDYKLKIVVYYESMKLKTDLYISVTICTFQISPFFILMKINQLSYPPRDGKGFQGFLPHWTNSILQQMKRKFWKMTDTLFRISRMTNSFK